MTQTTYEQIKAGLEQAVAIANGTADRSTYRLHTPLTLRLRHFRRLLELSRAEFAAQYGLDPNALEAWEQGRVDLDAGQQTLVKLILDDPDNVRRVLAKAA